MPSEEETIHNRYRGNSIPGYEGYTVSSIAKRSVARGDQTETCEQTGEEIPSKTKHLYVTARKDLSEHVSRFETFAFVDEDALEQWLAQES